jgi:hypothetical protein
MAFKQGKTDTSAPITAKNDCPPRAGDRAFNRIFEQPCDELKNQFKLGFD